MKGGKSRKTKYKRRDEMKIFVWNVKFTKKKLEKLGKPFSQQWI